MYSKSALLVFLFIFLCSLNFILIEALQCYDCSNCEDGEDLNELQICGGVPPTMRPTKQTTTTTKQTSSTTTLSTNSSNINITVAANTTVSPVPDEDFDYSDEETGELVVRPANTTLRPGNIRTSRRTTTTTTTKSIRTTRTTTTRRPTANENEGLDVGDNDYDGDDADDDDWRKRRNNQIFSRANEAVCYMVKFRANNTVITKRGCATMVHNNNVLTCQSIISGKELYDCQLCTTNGCNKFTEQNGDWEAIWNAGGKVQAKVWLTAPLLMLLSLWKNYINK